jgi:hypothetical protein
MKSLFKSTTATVAVAMIGIAVMSLAPASATTVVRDHRDGAPVVRDHRDGSSGGGVTVKDSPKPRTVHIKYKNPVCLGPFCL